MATSTCAAARRIRFLYVHAHGHDRRETLGHDPLLEFVSASEASVLSGAVEHSGSDVVLIDAGLPEPAWRNVISSTNKPCILLGSAYLDECVIPCLIAGAKGHLSDDEVPDQIRHAAETVLSNNVYAGPALTWRLCARLAALSGGAASAGAVETTPTAELTIAETKILNLIASGLTNKSIAETLRVSPHTVANHVHNLLKKLKARHRWEAVGMSEVID
jgi:two-component system, NarL family, response regulator DevR